MRVDEVRLTVCGGHRTLVVRAASAQSFYVCRHAARGPVEFCLEHEQR